MDDLILYCPRPQFDYILTHYWEGFFSSIRYLGQDVEMDCVGP